MVVGMLTAVPAMAQQSAVVSEHSTATITHNDPIVQKRMEVREANREHRANRAEARQTFRGEVSESRAERNQSVQDSRARAQEALNAAN
jgi:hypothetical protein